MQICEFFKSSNLVSILDELAIMKGGGGNACLFVNELSSLYKIFSKSYTSCSLFAMSFASWCIFLPFSI